MSASGLKDALITNLGAASVFGSNQVGTDYSVMETSSACCAVISWTGYESSLMTMGSVYRADWTMAIDVYLKDTGNPLALQNNVFAIIDKVVDSLTADPALQGEAKAISTISAAREPGEAFTAAGATWLQVPVRVTAQVWT